MQLHSYVMHVEVSAAPLSKVQYAQRLGRAVMVEDEDEEGFLVVSQNEQGLPVESWWAASDFNSKFSKVSSPFEALDCVCLVLSRDPLRSTV